jgi:hypothetical protein
MAVSPLDVRAKAKAFVDALCKLPRSEHDVVPHAHYGHDCNTLLLLALEACPELDERLVGNPVPIRTLPSGQEVCDASFAEIETYARQVLEQLSLRQQLDSSPQNNPRCLAPAIEVPAKAYDVTDVRQRHAQAYAGWSPQDDERLRERFGQGATVDQLVVEFGRQPGGIRSRLRKLGLTGPDAKAE